jgi:hypothetical protein
MVNRGRYARKEWPRTPPRPIEGIFDDDADIPRSADQDTCGNPRAGGREVEARGVTGFRLDDNFHDGKIAGPKTTNSKWPDRISGLKPCRY